MKPERKPLAETELVRWNENVLPFPLPQTYSPGTTSAVVATQTDVTDLLRALLEEIRGLRADLARNEPGEDEAREFPVEEGKRALLAWYASHPGEHYPSDAATELGMDFVQARDLTDELVREGRLR